MKIDFIKVDDKTIEIAKKMTVMDYQQHNIETVEECCIEAAELDLWRPMIITIDDVNVGFCMYGLWENEGKKGRVWFDRFLIDRNFQGKGYSKILIPILLKKISQEYYQYDEIFLSVYETNTVAINIYESIGFYFNGEIDSKGEKVMVCKINRD